MSIPSRTAPRDDARVPPGPARLLLWLFLGTLAVFALLTVFGPGAAEHVSTAEKRNLAPLPDLPHGANALQTFPGRFEAWFDDHLLGRAWLYQRYSLLRLKLFQESSSPEVVVGRDGWLFYDARPFPEQSAGTMLDDYRGLVRLSEARMEFMQLVLQTRRDWLTRRGIQYLFLVVPDKQSVESEHLPARLAHKIQPGTVLDQFEGYLRTHSQFPLLDLRANLQEAKLSGAEPELYLRTDTHWNFVGATLGQETIVGRLQEMMPWCSFPPPFEPVRGTKTEPGGDLAGLLNLSAELPETVPTLTNLHPHIHELGWRFPGYPAWEHRANSWSSDAPGARLRVVLFRDSCFINMLETFLERCAEVVAVPWQPALQPSDFDAKRRLLDTVHPDVVIEEVVERDLVRLLTNEGDPALADEIARCQANR